MNVIDNYCYFEKGGGPLLFSLPNEIIEYVLSFLQLPDIGRFLKVCRYTNQFLSHSRIWRVIYERMFKDFLLPQKMPSPLEMVNWKEKLRTSERHYEIFVVANRPYMYNPNKDDDKSRLSLLKSLAQSDDIQSFSQNRTIEGYCARKFVRLSCPVVYHTTSRVSTSPSTCHFISVNCPAEESTSYLCKADGIVIMTNREDLMMSYINWVASKMPTPDFCSYQKQQNIPPLLILINTTTPHDCSESIQLLENFLVTRIFSEYKVFPNYHIQPCNIETRWGIENGFSWLKQTMNSFKRKKEDISFSQSTTHLQSDPLLSLGSKN